MSFVVCGPQGKRTVLVLQEKFDTGTVALVCVCNLHLLSFFLGKKKAVKAPWSVPPSWLLLLTFTPELSDVVIETKMG